MSDARRMMMVMVVFCGIVAVSLVLNYLTEVRRLPVMGEKT